MKYLIRLFSAVFVGIFLLPDVTKLASGIGFLIQRLLDKSTLLKKQTLNALSLTSYSP